MFTLPNIDATATIEVDGLVLVSSRDQRVRELAAAHPNFGIYLDSFRTEFGDSRPPSVMLWRNDSPQTYRSVEALAGFRDAVAVATIPYGWAHTLYFENNFNIRYANWFSFYPWLIDAKYEGIVMQSMAQTGWHEAQALRAQTSPGISHIQLTEYLVDRPLLNALLERWKRRFATETPGWGDTALFRSLNMALSAAMLPGNVEVTVYDIGRAIALWVSAFEILAHPGTGVGYVQVYELLEKTTWNLTECAEAQYEPLGYKHGQPKRILPVWLYGELTRARNDFFHGNAIGGSRLIVSPAKRSLHFYAPLLYRMALSSFLEVKAEKGPAKDGETDYDAHRRHMFEFGKYQRDIEAALATVLSTVEEHRAQRQGPRRHSSRREPAAGAAEPSTDG